MLLPAALSGGVRADGYAEAKQNLFALDALFAEAFVVKAFCRPAETREWQKCLHVLLFVVVPLVFFVAGFVVKLFFVFWVVVFVVV